MSEDKLREMAELLPDDEIEARLGQLGGWTRSGDAITKSFDRGDFVGSVEFARRIVEPAEEMNHHPDLSISWSEVEVSITNHSAGGLTAADFELAGRIDELA
jgi:4a-hydroxytetrahydrobiopterin dehydratase